MMAMALDEGREDNHAQEVGEHSWAPTQWEKVEQVLKQGFEKLEMGIQNMAYNQLTMNSNFNCMIDQLIELMENREKPQCKVVDEHAMHLGNMSNP